MGENKEESREGISGNCKSQRRSKLAPNGINSEVPAVKFQRRFELAPEGIYSEAPAKAKRNPREGISRDFHSQVRSELALKGNKFRGVQMTIFMQCTISTQIRVGAKSKSLRSASRRISRQGDNFYVVYNFYVYLKLHASGKISTQCKIFTQIRVGAERK